ncbi:hypothetical protein GBAR_LOCUS12655, partial [Geodia barretti]
TRDFFTPPPVPIPKGSDSIGLKSEGQDPVGPQKHCKVCPKAEGGGGLFSHPTHSKRLLHVQMNPSTL